MESYIESNIENLKTAFSQFDKKSKGIISLQSLGPLLRSLGFNPKESEIDDLVNEIDIDRSGKIDFEEYLHLMSYLWQLQEALEDTARKIFEAFDIDRNGSIDAEELKSMATEFGYEDFTEQDSLEMIAVIDSDGNGEIELEDFISMFGEV